MSNIKVHVNCFNKQCIKQTCFSNCCFLKFLPTLSWYSSNFLFFSVWFDVSFRRQEESLLTPSSETICQVLGKVFALHCIRLQTQSQTLLFTPDFLTDSCFRKEHSLYIQFHRTKSMNFSSKMSKRTRSLNISRWMIGVVNMYLGPKKPLPICPWSHKETLFRINCQFCRKNSTAQLPRACYKTLFCFVEFPGTWRNDITVNLVNRITLLSEIQGIDIDDLKLFLYTRFLV